MARTPSRNHRSSGSRSRGTSSGKSSPAVKIIIFVLAAAVIIGLGVGLFKMLGGKGYVFQREHLDKYVASTQAPNPQLDSGASVYIDMSDGMISAYASETHKSVLQAIINKMSGNNGVEFFELAGGAIKPLNKQHTQLYNYVININSYNNKKSAPIENTLKKIVNDNKPAVLLTDFEEYRDGTIYKSAYAKPYFIEWLKKGYQIKFYKWDFVEKKQNKVMFVAVFDDNAGALISKIDNAVSLSRVNLPTFVLAGKDFAFPVAVNYPSVNEGGNYRNSAGNDLVTGVMAKGGPEDYKCYCKTVGSATGTGDFAPLDIRAGSLAEYYPVGLKWTDVIKCANDMKQAPKREDAYTHLLSALSFDFGAQSGYTISGIEVRTFDMQKAMEKLAAGTEIGDADMPEINTFLTAGMQRVPQNDGWYEIYVDMDSKFNGEFVGAYQSDDLIRANIVISSASPNTNATTKFFSWQDNSSLADAVKLTLSEPSCNPTGRILYTYYIKSIAK